MRAYRFWYLSIMAKTHDPFPTQLVANLRLKDLFFLQRIGDLNSLSKAAVEFGVTQPAASRWLRGLESLLRAHLFVRDRMKGMTPTPLGELVVERCRALLSDVSSLDHDVEALKAGRGGRIHLGAIPYVPARLLERLVSELITKHAMTVTVVEAATEPLLEGLRMQRLHAVIGRCSALAADAQLKQEVLFRQKASLLVSSNVAIKGDAGRRLSAFAGFKWISPPDDSPTWHAIVAAATAAREALPRPTLETASTKLVHALVRANDDVVGILPADVAAELEKLGGVRALPFPAAFSMPPVGLIAQARQWNQTQVKTVRTVLRRLVAAPASIPDLA